MIFNILDYDESKQNNWFYRQDLAIITIEEKFDIRDKNVNTICLPTLEYKYYMDNDNQYTIIGNDFRNIYVYINNLS